MCAYIYIPRKIPSTSKPATFILSSSAISALILSIVQVVVAEVDIAVETDRDVHQALFRERLQICSTVDHLINVN